MRLVKKIKSIKVGMIFIHAISHSRGNINGLYHIGEITENKTLDDKITVLWFDDYTLTSIYKKDIKYSFERNTNFIYKTTLNHDRSMVYTKLFNG